MDDYIYFMSEDGHGIDRCRIADFGKGGRERFFYRDDIIISRFVAEGKYVYFYSERTDEGKGCICRVDRDDPSDIYYTILDFKDDVSITALNVYNGYVYYAISSQQSDQYRSNIIGITTHGDDGWSDSDINKLCSIEDNYAVCGITFDPYQNSSMVLGVTPDGNEICAGSNMDFSDSLMVLY